MNNLVEKFFFLSFVVLLLGACCKKTSDPCDGVKCSSNQTCNDGKCECAVPSYKLRDVCIPKSDNTYFFGGKGCYCIPDTFTLTIRPNTITGSKTDFGYSIPFGNSFGGGTIQGDFYPKNDGDSLRILTLFNSCTVKGKTCFDEVIGKKVGADQLMLTIRFFEPNNYDKTIDQCSIVMKK